MGRGFVLTNTRSYSHVLMTTLLVGVCAFIIIYHALAQAHIQQQYWSRSKTLSYTTINHTSSMPTLSSWSIWLFLNVPTSTTVFQLTT